MARRRRSLGHRGLGVPARAASFRFGQDSPCSSALVRRLEWSRAAGTGLGQRRETRRTPHPPSYLRDQRKGSPTPPFPPITLLPRVPRPADTGNWEAWRLLNQSGEGVGGRPARARSLQSRHRASLVQGSRSSSAASSPTSLQHPPSLSHTHPVNGLQRSDSQEPCGGELRLPQIVKLYSGKKARLLLPAVIFASLLSLGWDHPSKISEGVPWALTAS